MKRSRLAKLFRSRRRAALNDGEARVRIEKTPTGWSIDYRDSDPERRYQPLPNKTIRRLQREAEERYRISQQEQNLASMI